MKEPFEIRPLSSFAELGRCVELQIAVWGYDDTDVIPKKLFIVANRIGGQVLGAIDRSKFGTDAIIGFAMALPGYRDGRSYLHSHMLAVLPEYRNAGLGRRLKLAQRDDALARGIARMEWTFDPLEIKNAHLNIARLGTIARRYLHDFYGPSSSPLQGGLPTDRLIAEWWLSSPRVHSILSETNGNPQPAPVSGNPVEKVWVPKSVAEWKQRPSERNLAEALQTQNRNALEHAFARGLAIVGFERTTEGDGCYLLGAVTGLE
jgi:predicted GNAT superfamily acetyltransferase